MENPEYWFVGKGWRIFHLEMGILERLNRTLKWDFVFWHEVDTFEDLQKLDSEFKDWYNKQRIHSAINYQTPWQKLLDDVKLSYSVG